MFKISSLLTILIYFTNVSQVVDWVEKHGEQFLSRSVGVGRNLQKAASAQRSQDNFEKVVQVRIFIYLVSILISRRDAYVLD